jgi:hypothetical protein
MDAATLQSPGLSRTHFSLADGDSPRMVRADEFRELIVSHRRMRRVDRRADRIRGLEDLDTGEVFLTEERWLFDAGR